MHTIPEIEGARSEHAGVGDRGGRRTGPNFGSPSPSWLEDQVFAVVYVNTRAR